MIKSIMPKENRFGELVYSPMERFNNWGLRLTTRIVKGLIHSEDTGNDTPAGQTMDMTSDGSQLSNDSLSQYNNTPAGQTMDMTSDGSQLSNGSDTGVKTKSIFGGFSEFMKKKGEKNAAKRQAKADAAKKPNFF